MNVVMDVCFRLVLAKKFGVVHAWIVNVVDNRGRSNPSIIN